MGATVEETCAASSPPGRTRCVNGTTSTTSTIDDTVTFPDRFRPEQCTYDVFRIRVRGPS